MARLSQSIADLVVDYARSADCCEALKHTYNLNTSVMSTHPLYTLRVPWPTKLDGERFQSEGYTYNHSISRKLFHSHTGGLLAGVLRR
jgi:hypothetical protein